MRKGFIYICKMQIEVIYDDDFFTIVNKPNNVLIHKSFYARNIKDKTLLQLLFDQTEEIFYPVHRLDRKTSGVLLLAKKKENVAVLQNLFKSNEINKIYFGIVRGFVNEEKLIKSPVKNPDTGVYKEAETSCIPILSKELPIAIHPYKNSRYSLVKLIPQTGRMHQLRIHMNKISHPIVGDYKYGDRFHNRNFENNFNCHHMFLHAHELEFIHPFTNNNISVKALFPKDWLKIFDEFNWELNL